jgi:hypothetical protein
VFVLSFLFQIPVVGVRHYVVHCINTKRSLLLRQTATKDRCFLCGPCRDAISGTVSEEWVQSVTEVDEQSVWGVLKFSRCVLLLLEAGSRGRGDFGSREEGERSPLEAATKQRLLETVTDWGHYMCNSEL